MILLGIIILIGIIVIIKNNVELSLQIDNLKRRLIYIAEELDKTIEVLQNIKDYFESEDPLNKKL